METKKSVQPQQQNQNKKPGNISGNSANNKNAKKDDNQGRQSDQGIEEDVEEKSFQRNPGGQADPQQGKRAILNEEQQDEIINDEEEVENDID